MGSLDLLVDFWMDLEQRVDAMEDEAVMPYESRFACYGDDRVHCYIQSRLTFVLQSWFGSEIGVAAVIF